MSFLAITVSTRSKELRTVSAEANYDGQSWQEVKADNFTYCVRTPDKREYLVIIRGNFC